jgi:hypothetical protein
MISVRYGLSVHQIATVRRRNGPENTSATFCGSCDLDDSEPHLVAQSQRNSRTTAGREKKNEEPKTMEP